MQGARSTRVSWRCSGDDSRRMICQSLKRCVLVAVDQFESVLQLLNRARIEWKIYTMRLGSRSDVFNYFEMFYNSKCLHRFSIELSLVEFELHSTMSF